MDADRRITELELRLTRYHEQLEAAIEQRDRFVLGAAWGVVRGILIPAVFIGALAASRHWFPSSGWLVTAAITVGATLLALLIAGLIGLYLERAEASDEGKFWRLPRWSRDD
jgi:hypothetical protein